MAGPDISPQFLVSDTDWKAKNEPHFTRPEVVGYYSLNEKREFLSNLSRLKYCQLPESTKVEVDVDLNGIEVVPPMPYDPTTEKLDRLLEWMLENLSKIRARPEETRWITPDFVCYRGLLKTLWCTLYNTKEPWAIYACKWRETIYLCACETEASEKKKGEADLTNPESSRTLWQCKFERYEVSETPDQPLNDQTPVNVGEFNCVFKSRLGRNVLLYGARIDAVSSKVILKDPVNWNEQKFVKLKAIKRGTPAEENLQVRYLKWWCESNLASNESVLCGRIDANGFLRELRKLSVAGMLEITQELEKEARMQDFCQNFLNWVQSVVVEDYEQALYKVEYHPEKENTERFKLGRLRLQKLSGESEFSLLPEWFVKEAKP